MYSCVEGCSDLVPSVLSDQITSGALSPVTSHLAKMILIACHWNTVIQRVFFFFFVQIKKESIYIKTNAGI